MKYRRQRRPDFPAELLEEAKRYPDGWVYEIDGRYDRDGAVPAHAVRRGWRVGSDGTPTSEYQDNPGYGERKSLSDVEQVLADAKALSSADQLRLLVADDLVLRGESIPFDVGITLITDKVLAMGYVPEEPWMQATDGGRTYRFRRVD